VGGQSESVPTIACGVLMVGTLCFAHATISAVAVNDHARR